MVPFNRRLFAPLAALALNAGLLPANLVAAGPESASSCDVHIAATAEEAAAAVASGAPFVLPGALEESLFYHRSQNGQNCNSQPQVTQVEKVALSGAPGDDLVFVSPPRCYAAPSPDGTRHLSGALSCAWLDDREITLQLTSALDRRRPPWAPRGAPPAVDSSATTQSTASLAPGTALGRCGLASRRKAKAHDRGLGTGGLRARRARRLQTHVGDKAVLVSLATRRSGATFGAL